jgi:hypothetical protein
LERKVVTFSVFAQLGDYSISVLAFAISLLWCISFMEVILLLSITWCEKVPFDGEGCVSFGVGNMFLGFGLVLRGYGLWRLVVREIKRFKQKQNDLILENQNPRMIVYFDAWFIVNWEQQYQL